MWIGMILLEDTAENWVGEEKIVKKWFKNASREVEKIKFSYPGEEDTPSPGPYPPRPRPFGPWHVSSAPPLHPYRSTVFLDAALAE